MYLEKVAFCEKVGGVASSEKTLYFLHTKRGLEREERTVTLAKNKFCLVGILFEV